VAADTGVAVEAIGDDNLIGLDHFIDFPDHSRSYDSTRRAVRFWGHDSAIEASFFIDEDALGSRLNWPTRL
jgi:hypothetical protein